MELFSLAERAVRSTAYRDKVAPRQKPKVTARPEQVRAEPAEMAVRGEVVPRRDRPMPSYAEIMDKISEQWQNRYAYYQTPQAADTVLAWALHTHYKKDGVLIWDATPRLGVFSRKPQSGKSTVLEQLNLICPDTNGLDINPTQYGLQYSLNQENATILLDEGDVSAIAKATVAIWNAGYTRNGQVLNGSRTRPTRVPVFGPIALAALDTMKRGRKGEDLLAALSRTIQITMVPGPHERWSRQTGTDGAVARNALAWIAQQTMPDLDLDQDLDMPPWLAGDYRKAQIWRPLFLACQTVGGGWPDRILRASRPSADFPAEAFAALGLDDEKNAAALAAFDTLTGLNRKLEEST